MKTTFWNYWEGNSMKDGGAFPVCLFEVFADLHPSIRAITFTFLNFGITIDFGEKKKNSGFIEKKLKEAALRIEKGIFKPPLVLHPREKELLKRSKKETK